MNENKEFEHEIDPDLLAEIEEWEKADHDEPAEYYFSNPDPYLKPQPLPSDHPRRNCYFNEDGHLCAKNLSAFWVPELTVTEVIHETVNRLFIARIGVFVTCVFPIQQFFALASASHGNFSTLLRHIQTLSLPKISSGKCSSRTGCFLLS